MMTMRTWCVLAIIGFAAHDTRATVVSGTVVDVSGKPIEDVRIDHIGKLVVVGPPDFKPPASPDAPRTDGEGNFEVTTTSPAIVIRKPGYESQRIRVTEDLHVRITLQQMKPFPECKVKVPRVKRKNASDVDYTGFWTYVDTKNGRKGIITGHGPTYTLGGPNDRDVWNSIEYTEVMYDNGIVDARGRAADGTYWRSQSIFGSAAQYYNEDRATAEILDCIMDRAPLEIR